MARCGMGCKAQLFAEKQAITVHIVGQVYCRALSQSSFSKGVNFPGKKLV